MGKVDSLDVPAFMANGPDYEADYCAWSEEQGRRLRLLRIPGVDTENIAEEIESLGRSDRQQIASRMEVLLMHLLKWRYQPELAGRSWRSTILVQRQKITGLVNDSPSLRLLVDHVAQDNYEAAVARAALETGLFEDAFPATCEWTAGQVLDPEFLPEPPA